MEKTSCVFLCGDRSAYGMAHLEAIAEHFDLRAVLIADDRRWKIFSDRLSGGETQTAQRRSVRSVVRNLARQPIVALRAYRHRQRLRKTTLIECHDANTPETVQRVGEIQPQVLLSAAYPQILRKEILKIAPRGAVNFHPSALPLFRGAHPHYWSLATGADTGGVTAHYMTTQIDSGDIIAQQTFSLQGLYYADLYSKIIEETPALVEAVARFFDNPNAKGTPQDEALATTFRGEREIHRRLDFSTISGRDLVNRIRAGRAFAYHREQKIEIDRAQLADEDRPVPHDASALPGTIVDIREENIVVATIDGSHLLIERLIRDGQPLSPGRWAARERVNVGESLQ